MGQVFDKLEGKEWRQRQIRKITDRVFDKVKNQMETDKLNFEDLYIAVLLSCDINLDGDIDRDEFYDFIMIMTADTFTFVSQKLIVTFVVAPTVAVATKKATEGVPGVGKLVQKIPNSVYASLVTIAAVWFQKKAQSSSL
ncbi:hypothetical protein GmHk_07G019224 [Glycine max]|nr:hypothetical protein GmHk_07G019224 [Glycine max]